MNNRHAMVGPVDLWEMKREFQFTFLLAQGLKPQDYLLDIGCGTLRGGIPLIEYLNTSHYYGIEARPSVLAEGRAELTEANLEHKTPILITANNFEVSQNITFDFIFMFSVLIHLEDNLVDLCFEKISKQLKTTGSFYGNVNLCSRSTGAWEGFPVNGRSLEFYADLASKHKLMVLDMGTLDALGHNSSRIDQDAQHMLQIQKFNK